MYLSRPLTMGQLCEQMGIAEDPGAPRRMARLIRRREREIQKKILVGGGQGRKLTVTIAALRKSCPDLVDEIAIVSDIIEEYLGEMNGKLRELKLRDGHLAASIRANKVSIQKLAKVCQT